jgi:hypothetical protein
LKYLSLLLLWGANAILVPLLHSLEDLVHGPVFQQQLHLAARLLRQMSEALLEFFFGSDVVEVCARGNGHVVCFELGERAGSTKATNRSDVVGDGLTGSRS